MSEEQQQIVNLDDVSSSGGRPFLKSGEYSIRCVECEKATSKKNNPMMVFKWELISPAEVQDATGKAVKIAGIQFTVWIVLNEMSFQKIKALHKTAKLPMTINIKAPDVRQYLGKAIKVRLTTEVDVLKDENTNEPMLDDEGRPITMNNYRISRYNSADLENTIPSDSVAF